LGGDSILYHLSLDSGLTSLTPRVPECAISTYENTSTKRICFSDFIEGCLSALQDSPSKYYVYIPENIQEDEIYYPTVYDVRDCKYTHEVWVLNTIKVKCIGIIESSECDWIKRHNSGRGRTTFFHYPYKWIEKWS